MLTNQELRIILTLLNRVEVRGREEAFALVVVCQKIEKLLSPAPAAKPAYAPTEKVPDAPAPAAKPADAPTEKVPDAPATE
jgi:hypothetical protein